MKGIVFSFLVGFCCLNMANAADISTIYDKATLTDWEGRYERTTNKILNEVIWPVLLSDEIQQFGRKPKLEFPLYAEGDSRSHPLNFYAPGNGTIQLPVFSLKFLDDLCTAYAWLQLKGYSLETVSEYTAILFYGKPPPGGFPKPLKALGIPENALDDPKVDELALGHFVTARTFILLHEMGHILYRHRAINADQSIANEQQADRFAATVMHRTPLPPLGMLVWFLADAHWTGFPPQQGTHPLSGKRVSALAENIDDPELAKQIRELGKLFDDPDIRAGFVATGKAGDLAALTPRHSGEMPKIVSKLESQQIPFHGTYRGESVQFGDESKPFPIELSMERHNDHVTGQYSFGLGIGSIEGNVEGKWLYFDWSWASNYGKGVFEDLGNGSFKGTWGYHDAPSGAGTWSAIAQY